MLHFHSRRILSAVFVPAMLLLKNEKQNKPLKYCIKIKMY